jgi:hydroxymethylbilane synthase
MHIRLGTRQSPLALWQANHVSSRLHQLGHDVELVKIVTTGDVSTTSLGSGGSVGLFTKEIQRALLDERCDLAVHSLKDLPTEAVPGLVLCAVPERENSTDCMISRTPTTLYGLPEGAKVGTGSPRRRAQLLRLRSDLELLEIRGNVDTRLKKLEAGDYDAIVLAFAGLHRLGLDASITQQFTFDELLPAVGQGALGLECRSDDEGVMQALEDLNDKRALLCVAIERALLRTMRAGCLAPLAAQAFFEEEKLRFSCRVFSRDYSAMIEQHWSWHETAIQTLEQAEFVGTEAAQDLRELGAAELMFGEE